MKKLISILILSNLAFVTGCNFPFLLMTTEEVVETAIEIEHNYEKIPPTK